MSQETEWAQGQIVDDVPKRATILPLVFWGIAFLILVVSLLSGCATEAPKSPSPRTDVCFVQDLGQSRGMQVVALSCITQAEFEALQK